MERHDFHSDFRQRVTADAFLGASLLEALNENAPLSVRYNPIKSRAELPVATDVDWCSDAFYLSERPSYTLDPLFHAGAYYPQEAGSMVIDHVLHQLELPENPIVLDLCGAPGGKSTLVLSFLNHKGLLVSNEVIQARSRILKENCTKWGYSNSIVTNNDPSDFDRLPSFFDVALIDAPCSGEGMFRKDPAARSEWSQDNVKLCAARQKRILGDIWSSIKPGAYIIYSTCTFNEDENEKNVVWMEENFGATRVPISMPKDFKEGRNGIGHYALPGSAKSEGFFIAVLQKEGTGNSKIGTKGKVKIKSTNIAPEKDLNSLSEYALVDDIGVWRWKDYLLGIPKHIEEAALQVYNNMRIVKLGTELGTLARKGFVPSHDLSMAPALRIGENKLALSHEEALHYLKGETFALSGQKGMQMVTYQEEPLGWIKHLGNRFNNAYPKEWRIKMKLK